MQHTTDPVEQDTSGPPKRTWPGRLLPLVALLERVPWRIVGAVVGLLLFATALVVLQRVLRDVRYDDVRNALQSVGMKQLLYSLLATCFSYVALTGYDLFGLRHIGRKEVPYRTAALSAFTGYALSYTIGFQVFVAAAVRYRTYAEVGLSAVEVAGLTLVSGLTFWLGIGLVLGLGLSIKADDLAFLDTFGPSLNRFVGIALLLGIAIYLGWLFGKHRTVNTFGLRLPLPGFLSTLAQLGIGVADIIGASTALYVLLPETPGLTYTVFVAIFIVALCLGMASHAPGGAGVIEATMLLALPSVGPDRLIAALLIWRIVYYLLPFTLALLLLAALEFTRRRGLLARTGIAVAATLRPVAPVVIGVAVFVAGAAALILNLLPPGAARIRLVQAYLPLPVYETADVALSIVGISLMILSRAFLRRLAKAYRITRILLVAGIVAALLEALAWEIALIFAVALWLLHVNRRAFFRQDKLSAAPLTAPWVGAVVTVLLGSIWLGALIHTPAGSPWTHLWHFDWGDESARFYRAALATMVAGLVLLLVAMIRPRLERTFPTEVVAIVADSPRAVVSRALDGGHSFLLSSARDAFILYDVSGRSWIALGDPVGAWSRSSELSWSFRDLADRNGGWPVFFDADPTRVQTFLDLGLAPLNYGDAASIVLSSYEPTLRAEVESGLSTRIVTPGRLPAMTAKLRAIDPTWPSYVGTFTLVVASRDGEPVAFGRLLRGARRAEMALDAVRLADGEGPETLRALLEAAIAQAKREGYERFDLGTAPQAPHAEQPNAPSLGRDTLGLFRYGEIFEEPADLRAFKQAFDPAWTPRFLACPGGLALPQILLDVAAVCAERPYRSDSPRFGPNFAGFRPAKETL